MGQDVRLFRLYFKLIYVNGRVNGDVDYYAEYPYVCRPVRSVVNP